MDAGSGASLTCEEGNAQKQKTSGGEEGKRLNNAYTALSANAQ